MFESCIAKIKQHPVLFVNISFTFFCATYSMSSGIQTLWLLSWLLIPLLFSTHISLPCVVYMSLYMQIVRGIELFSILVCISFTTILIKQIICLNKNKLLNKYFKILLYYLILLISPLFYSIFITGNMSIQFIYYLNMINILLLIYLNKNILNKDLILTYTYGIFTSSFLSIALYFAGLHYFPFYGGVRFTAYLPLCNTLAAACVVCVALVYMLMSNKQIKTIHGWTLIGVLSIIGMITLSKNFFIVYSILILIIMINSFKSSQHKKRFVGVSCFILLLLSPVLIVYFIKMFDRFFIEHDYYKNIINILTTGRLDKWIIYLTPFFNNILSILCGVGICYPYPTEYSSHSLYVGYLSRLGVWGFVLLGYFIHLVIQKQTKPGVKFKFLPLIALAIICLAEDISFNTFYFIPFIIASCSCD